MPDEKKQELIYKSLKKSRENERERSERNKISPYKYDFEEIKSVKKDLENIPLAYSLTDLKDEEAQLLEKIYYFNGDNLNPIINMNYHTMVETHRALKRFRTCIIWTIVLFIIWLLFFTSFASDDINFIIEAIDNGFDLAFKEKV